MASAKAFRKQLKESELFAASEELYGEVYDMLTRDLIPKERDLIQALARLQKALTDAKQ